MNSKKKFKNLSHNHNSWLFLYKFSFNMFVILMRLLSGEYSCSPTVKYKITRDGKVREYESYTIADRIVAKLLFHCLKTRLRSKISGSYFQCEGKGRAKANRALQHRLSTHKHVYKTDVYSYYNSIDQLKLTDLLTKELGDRKMIHLITSFLRAPSSIDKRERLRGIPVGCSFSMLLAEFYLRELDSYFDNRKGEYYYQRFNDDIIILSKGKKSHRRAIKATHIILKSLGCMLDERKLL